MDTNPNVARAPIMSIDLVENQVKLAAVFAKMLDRGSRYRNLEKSLGLGSILVLGLGVREDS